MKNKSISFLTQAAMIAAIYIVLTMIFAPLSFGQIQVRFAEALTVLPYFTPAAIPGLFVGCLLGNILGGAILPDVIFGSLATFAGAIITYLLRNHNKYLAPVGPIVANTLVVPLVLRYAYGISLPLWLMMLSVGGGELLSCGVLGIVILLILDKYRHIIFR